MRIQRRSYRAATTVNRATFQLHKPTWLLMSSPTLVMNRIPMVETVSLAVLLS
jgi:hypothetical protein